MVAKRKEEPLADNSRPIKSDKKKAKWRKEHREENDALVALLQADVEKPAAERTFDAKPYTEWTISDLNRIMITHPDFKEQLNGMVEHNDKKHLLQIMPNFFNGEPIGDLEGPGGDVHRYAHLIEAIYYGNERGWQGAADRFPERVEAADTTPYKKSSRRAIGQQPRQGSLEGPASQEIDLGIQDMKGVEAVRSALASVSGTMTDASAHASEAPLPGGKRTARQNTV